MQSKTAFLEGVFFCGSGTELHELDMDDLRLRSAGFSSIWEFPRLWLDSEEQSSTPRTQFFTKSFPISSTGKTGGSSSTTPALAAPFEVHGFASGFLFDTSLGWRNLTLLPAFSWLIFDSGIWWIDSSWLAERKLLEQGLLSSEDESEWPSSSSSCIFRNPGFFWELAEAFAQLAKLLTYFGIHFCFCSFFAFEWPGFGSFFFELASISSLRKSLHFELTWKPFFPFEIGSWLAPSCKLFSFALFLSEAFSTVVSSLVNLPLPKYLCSFMIKILLQTKAVFIDWCGTRSYCFSIFLLLSSVKLCDKLQLHGNCRTTFGQIWRYGHFSDLHSSLKYNWQTCGRLQAMMFRCAPFGCFSIFRSLVFASLSLSRKSCERRQSPSHFPSIKLLQMCQNLHEPLALLHEPRARYCWQIFFFSSTRTAMTSSFISFTSTKRPRPWFVSQFFASKLDFMFFKGDESFKSRGNSTNPPLPQIKLKTFSTKTSSAILALKWKLHGIEGENSEKTTTLS